MLKGFGITSDEHWFQDVGMLGLEKKRWRGFRERKGGRIAQPGPRDQNPRGIGES